MAGDAAGKIEFEKKMVDEGRRQSGEANDFVHFDRSCPERFDEPLAVGLTGLGRLAELAIAAFLDVTGGGGMAAEHGVQFGEDILDSGDDLGAVADQAIGAGGAWVER